MQFERSESFAQKLDQEDELSEFRGQFLIPPHKNGADSIYFCGNSLGLEPRACRAQVNQILDQWQNLGVEGWFDDSCSWLTYHQELNRMLAPMVGAKPSEVAIANTLTMNLHLMMASFYRPTKTRSKILIEAKAFPSDQYAVKSQLNLHGFDAAQHLIEVSPRAGETLLRDEDILQSIETHGDSTALVLLSGVNYYSGQVFDMQAIARAAKAKGCMVGFDLAHAAGNIILKLHDWQADFACWCNYKYLNAGPGSVGAFFVHEKHHAAKLPRLEGWWGNDLKSRFKMEDTYDPAPGAEAWVNSTHSPMLLASLRSSLEIFSAAGMPRLRKKSELLTGYLEYLLTENVKDLILLITPKEVSKRGCQLSVSVKRNGKAAFQALTEAGVICDWREPDVIRLAPTPLYNTFAEVWKAAQIVRQVVASESR